jgi:outer membrane protein assembly factor BamB
MIPDNPKQEMKIPLIKWTKNFDPKYDSGNLPIGTHGPLIYKGLLFVGSAKKTMNAFDVESGTLIWSKKETYGPSARPSIYDNKWLIYGSNGGRVYSRNYLTGSVNYKIDLGSAIESAPVFHSGRGIFHLRNHKIVVLDALTGKVLWSYKRNIPFSTTLQGASEPVVVNNRVFVGFADGFVLCLRLEDGAVVWETKVAQKFKFIDVDMKPYVNGEFVYVGPKNGPLNVLKKSSGEMVRTLDYMVSRGPVILAGHTIWGTSDGKIVVLGKYDKELKQIKLSKGSISGLSFWKDQLLVGTSEGRLVMLNSDYKIVYNKHFGSVASSLSSEIETEGEYFAVYSSRNRLYVFKKPI